MKKIFVHVLITLMAFFIQHAEAKTLKGNLSDIVKQSDVDMAAISISIRDASTGKTVYTLNDKMPMNPASVQKVLTTPAAIETLGEDYEFVTEVYTRGKNNTEEILIKLGADPYLTRKDLKGLVDFTSRETKKVYIDDSVLDNKTWGEGWQWDDDLNTLMPRFGAYNLDGNIMSITIMPNEKGQYATIVNQSKYPVVFLNNIKTSKTTNIKVSRGSSVVANSLALEGTVTKPTIISVPVQNIKSYFNFQLTKVLENRKVYLKEGYKTIHDNNFGTLRYRTTHSLDLAIDDILKNSNNLVAETVFKLAGAKYAGNITGTDTSGIDMFQNFCNKKGLDTSSIRIVDGSGVSKNNILTSDFISQYLYVMKDSGTLKKLPKPGEGTLSLRLLPLKDSLRAKTGTLSNVSSIAGYLTSKSGKEYTFCIIDSDMKLTPYEKKIIEDYLIKEVYLKL